MNAGGWIFMLSSLALVWGATIWAYYRLLRSPREEPRDRALDQGAGIAVFNCPSHTFRRISQTPWLKNGFRLNRNMLFSAA
jgi:hypothetical protein